MTYIPNENARNLPTFSINKESHKRPKKPSVDFGGFVPLTRRGPLMIEENYRRPTNRIPLRPNFQQRYRLEIFTLLMTFENNLRVYEHSY